MKHHAFPIRIYYEDTDAGGIVYHGQYINFGERGRTEFLRHLGYNNSELTRELGTLFVVRHIDINYLKPAWLDDVLEIRTSVASMKNTSFVMHQTFFRQKDGAQEEVIADMRVALVCVEASEIKPKKIPDAVRKEFAQYMDEPSEVR